MSSERDTPALDIPRLIVLLNQRLRWEDGPPTGTKDRAALMGLINRLSASSSLEGTPAPSNFGAPTSVDVRQEIDYLASIGISRDTLEIVAGLLDRGSERDIIGYNTSNALAAFISAVAFRLGLSSPTPNLGESRSSSGVETQCLHCGRPASEHPVMIGRWRCDGTKSEFVESTAPTESPE